MSKQINYWLVFFTVAAMGVSVGSMLGEQKTLVPFWLGMQPDAFHAWYVDNAQQLKSFFSPLQISCVVLALIATIYCWIQHHPGTLWLGISLLFSVGVLATFFLFFKDANAAFATHIMPTEALSTLLADWSTWQWGRIALAASAFAAALYGLSRPQPLAK